MLKSRQRHYLLLFLLLILRTPSPRRMFVENFKFTCIRHLNLTYIGRDSKNIVDIPRIAINITSLLIENLGISVRFLINLDYRSIFQVFSTEITRFSIEKLGLSNNRTFGAKNLDYRPRFQEYRRYSKFFDWYSKTLNRETIFIK